MKFEGHRSGISGGEIRPECGQYEVVSHRYFIHAVVAIAVGNRSCNHDNVRLHFVKEIDIQVADGCGSVCFVNGTGYFSDTTQHNGGPDFIAFSHQIDQRGTVGADFLGHGNDLSAAHRYIGHDEPAVFISSGQARAATYCGARHRVPVCVKHHAAYRAEPAGQQNVDLGLRISLERDPCFAFQESGLFKGINPQISRGNLFKEK